MTYQVFRAIIKRTSRMHTIAYFTLIALLASIGTGMALIVTNDTEMAELTNVGIVLELSDSNENSELSRYPLFVLDCYVSWCEPCKDLGTYLQELSGELNGQVAFGSIDIEKNEETKGRYGVFSYPAILFFKNGTLVDSQIGYGSKSELARRLQMIEPDLDVSDIETNERPSVTLPEPSETIISRMPRNIGPDKMQIMPAPAPAAFRQFVENASGNNSSNFLPS